MPSNKQSAKSATFALLATMLRGCFQESMEPCSRKKEISFRENFWSGKPSKTVIYGKLADAKCQQSLTLQRFPKFSKRENDFEGHVIWWL